MLRPGRLAKVGGTKSAGYSKLPSMNRLGHKNLAGIQNYSQMPPSNCGLAESSVLEENHMSIGSVGSSHAYPVQAQTAVNSVKPVRQETENDGDKDDGRPQSVRAPSSTVNSQGQTTGTRISVTA